MVIFAMQYKSRWMQNLDPKQYISKVYLSHKRRWKPWWNPYLDVMWLAWAEADDMVGRDNYAGLRHACTEKP